MTRQAAAKHRDVINAWAAGKTIQYLHYTNEWRDIENPCFHPYTEYRIKPEPRWRPWRVEEVPVGKLARYKDGTRGTLLITGAVMLDIYIGIRRYDAANVLANMEVSLDDGKTWQPCGVLE